MVTKVDSCFLPSELENRPLQGGEIGNAMSSSFLAGRDTSGTLLAHILISFLLGGMPAGGAQCSLTACFF